MRARLALAASGQCVELREIVLRNKPEHMLQISPKGTVPVLLLASGDVVDESLDIMYWALQQSDPQQLLPSTDELLQQTVVLIAANDEVFKRHLDRYKYPPRYTEEHQGLTPEQFAAKHRDQAAQILLALDARLAEHAYLLGDQISLADIAIAPFIRQYAHTNLDWFLQQSWPYLLDWLQRFLDSDRFNQIMHKYTPWQPGDDPTYFPPQF